MTDLLNVFVYGTLKPGERYHDRYCTGKIVAAQEALIYGHLFHLPTLGYPALTVGDLPVRGFVFTLANAAVLQELDQLENYQPQRPDDQNEYKRVQTETFSLDHQPLGLAWVYQMKLEQAKQLGGVFLPNGYWTGR